MNYDFSGWATRANMRCGDGLVIMKDAFRECDGQTVPLVWNHQHNEAKNVLGHAMLENHDEGVYVRAKFNDTAEGQRAKSLVEHGDITALSIYANQLKKNNNYVEHGKIREVSLVLAGCNPGAFIDNVIVHGDYMEGIVYNDMDDGLFICHSDDEDPDPEEDKKENSKMSEEVKETKKADEKTVGDIINSMNEEQKKVLEFLVAQALSEKDTDENDEEDDANMKHNLFENTDYNDDSFLSHSDEMEILKIAKDSRASSLKQVMQEYIGDTALAHGIDQEDIGSLFPEPELITKGAPEVIREGSNQWVAEFFSGVTRSPYARVRTRHADARKRELEARGYKKGDKKVKRVDIRLLNRVTDPQTCYMVDQVHRDDIIDIEDFDYVEFVRQNMMEDFKEDLATAMFIGDGRDESDPHKIWEDHIRPIYKDNDLYVIHQDVDVESARANLNGLDTGKHFGDNYVYAEAIVEASLYAQEEYRGTKGAPNLYAAPHLINQMMLARDLNGRRIYNTRNELAAALNVNKIVEVKKFENVTRKDADDVTHSLLGFILNPADYQIGSTKDGQLTTFDDFDIDFNNYKYLIETRLSGALITPRSAIVLEEKVADGNEGTGEDTGA